MKSTRAQLLAEFIGSMFLVTAVVSSVIFFSEVVESSANIVILANAIAVTFVLAALIEVFGPVSGAHFNPIVTVVMLIDGKIGLAKAKLFIMFQVMGGIAGAVLSHLMFYEEMNGLFFVSETVRSGYSYIGEIAGTFILVLAILLLVKTKSTKTSIIVGMLVGGMLISTSSTMFANPQVTIARMFTSSAAGIRPIDGLIFIAMQFIGGLLAYGVYKNLSS